jgi:hypothetical protein
VRPTFSISLLENKEFTAEIAETAEKKLIQISSLGALGVLGGE